MPVLWNPVVTTLQVVEAIKGSDASCSVVTLKGEHTKQKVVTAVLKNEAPESVGKLAEMMTELGLGAPMLVVWWCGGE
jgi:hypothetical protein